MKPTVLKRIFNFYFDLVIDTGVLHMIKLHEMEGLYSVG